MSEVEQYAKLVDLGRPDFIEIKGVTFCGGWLIPPYVVSGATWISFALFRAGGFSSKRGCDANLSAGGGVFDCGASAMATAAAATPTGLLLHVHRLHALPHAPTCMPHESALMR